MRPGQQDWRRGMGATTGEAPGRARGMRAMMGATLAHPSHQIRRRGVGLFSDTPRWSDAARDAQNASKTQGHR